MGRKRFVRFKRSRFDRQMIDTFTYEQIISHGQPAMRTTRGRTPVSVRAEDLYYGRCAYCGRLLTATVGTGCGTSLDSLLKNATTREPVTIGALMSPRRPLEGR